MLTIAFFRSMVQRNRGGVINISSGFGLAILPMFAVYCGTKRSSAISEAPTSSRRSSVPVQ